MSSKTQLPSEFKLSLDDVNISLDETGKSGSPVPRVSLYSEILADHKIQQLLSEERLKVSPSGSPDLNGKEDVERKRFVTKLSVDSLRNSMINMLRPSRSHSNLKSILQ